MSVVGEQRLGSGRVQRGQHWSTHSQTHRKGKGMRGSGYRKDTDVSKEPGFCLVIFFWRDPESVCTQNMPKAMCVAFIFPAGIKKKKRGCFTTTTYSILFQKISHLSVSPSGDTTSVWSLGLADKQWKTAVATLHCEQCGKRLHNCHVIEMIFTCISWMLNVFKIRERARERNSPDVHSYPKAVEMCSIAIMCVLYILFPMKSKWIFLILFFVFNTVHTSLFSSRKSEQSGFLQRDLDEVLCSELDAPCWRLGSLPYPALQWLLGPAQHHCGKGRNTLCLGRLGAHTRKTVWGRSHRWEWKSEEFRALPRQDR